MNALAFRSLVAPLRAQGFTLLEVLIALVFLAIGLLAIVSLQSIALRATDFSGKMDIARILASDHVSRLMSLPYADPALQSCGAPGCSDPTPNFCYQDAGGGAVGTAVNLDSSGQASPAGSFRRQWCVMQQADPNVRSIRVRVSWSDIPGTTGAGAQAFNHSLDLYSQRINFP